MNNNRTYKTQAQRIAAASGFSREEMEARVKRANPTTETAKYFVALYGHRTDRDHLAGDYQYSVMVEPAFDSEKDARRWASQHAASYGSEVAGDPSIEIGYVRIVSTAPPKQCLDGTSDPFPVTDDPWLWSRVPYGETPTWQKCHHPFEQVGRGPGLEFCRSCQTRLLRGGYDPLPLPPNVHALARCARRHCDGWATAVVVAHHVATGELCGTADTIFCQQHAQLEIAGAATPEQRRETGLDPYLCEPHGQEVESVVDFAFASDAGALK